jgi:hypothetical protein
MRASQGELFDEADHLQEEQQELLAKQSGVSPSTE